LPGKKGGGTSSKNEPIRGNGCFWGVHKAAYALAMWGKEGKEEEGKKPGKSMFSIRNEQVDQKWNSLATTGKGRVKTWCLRKWEEGEKGSQKNFANMYKLASPEKRQAQEGG